MLLVLHGVNHLSDYRTAIALNWAGDNFSDDNLPVEDVVYLCAAMVLFVDCEADPKLDK